MAEETFYESLMRRQAETYNYKGKLDHQGQGRNGIQAHKGATP